MKLGICFAVAAWLVTAPAWTQAQEQGMASSPWERSVVTLEITRKQYDYLQPWTTRLKTTQKAGLVISPKEILTTADEANDRTLIRVQKGGRGKWFTGELTWIDYHANLALISVPEAGFWNGLRSAALAEPTRSEGELQIVRWRQGRFESRRAEFNQFSVGEGRLSFSPQLQMELSSEIQNAGWAEPIVSQGKVEGMLVSQDGNTCTAMPSAFIASILKARQAGTYHGLGYFDFVWQPSENPATLAFLKLPGEPRGALVISVPYTPGVQPIVKPRDVLLKVDGFDIDIQGDYLDPDYGPLMLENLATRHRWAGDHIPLEVLRDGKVQELSYPIPRADYKTKLVPDEVFDQEPEYVIVGGLVFQPLNDAFLHSWGPDWKRRSPFRLYYYNTENPTPERPGLVVLSQVLPDIYNLGYQDVKYLVVDEVNGKKISYLKDLREALTQPSNGFQIINFMQSDSLRRLVLSADQLEPATKRVLTRYGITKEFSIAENEKPRRLEANRKAPAESSP